MMLEEINALLQMKRFAQVKEMVSCETPADIAVLIEELFGEDYDERKDFLILFRLLPKDMAAETFTFMNPEMQRFLIEAFSDKELQEILAQSFIDDTVDIIEEMPANVVSRILKNSTTGARKAINEILQYPRDSAGSIMTIEYVSLHKDMTVEEAFAKIRRVGVNKETIYTAYVTENRKLIGMVTVKDLFMAEEDDKIAGIMETNMIYADTHEDKEIVARMFGKYNLLAMPVVDRDMRLVGIVTFDDVMDVIEEENTEDVTKMAAIAPSEEGYFRTGVFRHATGRVGWLLFLMISATMTRIIIDSYSNAFATLPILISFMPMLMDTGGNCGAQSSTMVIRGIALDEIRFSDFFKVVFKEFRISIIVSSILAIVNGIRIYVQYTYIVRYENSLLIAVTISASIIVTVIISKIIGSALPMIAKKCRLDPAIMAAPLITTIVDSCSIFIYFNIAMRIFNL